MGISQPRPEANLLAAMFRRHALGAAVLLECEVCPGTTHRGCGHIQTADQASNLQQSAPHPPGSKEDRDSRLSRPPHIQPGAGKVIKSRMRWTTGQLF